MNSSASSISSRSRRSSWYLLIHIIIYVYIYIPFDHTNGLLCLVCVLCAPFPSFERRMFHFSAYNRMIHAGHE